uniref:hypothetical protein n=1 Tax=Actinomadura roseirufa TaxID=2094049 RepID=UPI0013F176E9
VAALFALGGGGSGGGEARRTPEGPRGTAVPTAAAPKPVDIGDEKTDPKDLAFTEVFPQESVKLGGRTYVRDRWSINRKLSYAAGGTMLTALQRQGCRKIVRATYVDRGNSLTITAGVAVMPNKAASERIAESGDPVKYEWFRGMSAKHAPDVDRGGGFAGSTIRGRYVIYAYVQWANGKQAKPGDPMFKQVAQQFLDYTARPLEARVHA